MLYLLFFLLRDEDALSKRVKSAIPLRPEQLNALLLKFTVVIHATVKGDLLVALLQGALGGLIFWFLGITASLLWAILMVVAARNRSRSGLGAGRDLSSRNRFGLAGRGPHHLWRTRHWPRGQFPAPDPGRKGHQDARLCGVDLDIRGIEAFGLHGFLIGPVIAAMFIAVWDMFSASRQNDAFGV